MIETPEFEMQLRASLRDGVHAAVEPPGLVDRLLATSRQRAARPAPIARLRPWLLPVTAALTLMAVALVILFTVPHRTGSIRPAGPAPSTQPTPLVSSSAISPQRSPGSRPAASSSSPARRSQSSTSPANGKRPSSTPGRRVVTGGAPHQSGPLSVAISVSDTIDANSDGELDTGDQVVFSITLKNETSRPINAYNVSDTYREGDDTRYDCKGVSRPVVPAGGSIACVRTVPYLITAADTASGTVRRWAYAYTEPSAGYYNSTILTLRLR